MFNYEYPPLGGGGGVVHRHIAEQLALRHHVAVVTTGFADLPERENVAGVDVHRLKVVGRKRRATASVLSMLSFVPACLRYGQQLIERMKPDVINTHFAVPTGPAPTILARRHGVPHALCIHGGDIFDPSKRLSPHRWPGLKHTVRWVLRRADRVLAASTNTAQYAKQIYKYDKPIHIIPHGLPGPELAKADRSGLPIDPDAFVLVSLGRLVARKAYHDLVRLLARLRHGNLKLVILGEGPERGRIEAEADRLGVRHRLHMPGHVDDRLKYRWLQAADVFVSTSMHEGFGLMFIEAMFCGLPIVAYDHGGQCDFLEDGRTGYVVPWGDLPAFQQRVEALIRDEQFRRSAGRYCADLSEKFTIQHCASQYEDHFLAMVAQHNEEMPHASRSDGGSEAADATPLETCSTRSRSS